VPLPRPNSSGSTRPNRAKAAAWLTLEHRLEQLEGTWCDGEILNLSGWKTIRYRETADDVIILAELTTEIKSSCACGTLTANFLKWGFTEPSHVNDIPVRSKRTRIYFRVQRWRCPKCNTTFQQPLAGVDEKYSFTTRLVEYIGQESFSIFRNFSGVANEVGCSEITVRKIFTARSVRLEKLRVIASPKWLAIDEVYPKKNKIVYCVISDPERRRILDILPGNNQTCLLKWLLQLPERQGVEVVTMDMWPAYRAAVHRLLPNARIIVDRYHVHNLLNVALKKVLEVVRDSMTHSERRRYMRPELLVLKNYRHLSKEKREDRNGKEIPSEKELFTKWLKNVPDLATAYWLKKEFSDILQLSDRQKAENLVHPWLERVCEFVKYFRAKYEKNYSGRWEDPFGSIPNTITQWLASILNYIDLKDRFEIKPTNAFAEFANKQIKKAFRMGNGYRFEVLRAKVVHGGVLVNKRPPHPLDKQWTRTKPDRAARKRRGRRRETNPNSNIALLTRAREELDQTKDLLSKPQQAFGWATRFTSPQNKTTSDSDELFMDMIKDSETEKKTATKGRRAFRNNSNQLKIF
jgi:transposase